MDQRLFIAIVSIFGAVIIGFFSWIIFILRRQERSAIHSIKGNAGLDKRLSIAENNIDNIKEQKKGLIVKVEDLSMDINLLKTAIMETGLGLKVLKEDVKKVESKLDSIDTKIDLFIQGIGIK
jgi:peptidoglycan hydrolase CwlO-like protein